MLAGRCSPKSGGLDASVPVRFVRLLPVKSGFSDALAAAKVARRPLFLGSGWQQGPLTNDG